MAKKKRLVKIKKGDYGRVLVTETLPFETPIVFSNDGLYKIVSDGGKGTVERALLDRLVRGGQIKWGGTIPYKYKIRKTTSEYRQLCLIHPISQWRIKDFYRQYENLIPLFCATSEASIRAPERVASTFFEGTKWGGADRYKFKDGVVTEAWIDPFTRFSPTFFAYRGYDRLYKFFNSEEFFQLEKNFNLMCSLDVSKCFDSIYTHSLSWALKDKNFTKEHVDITSTFAQQFDRIMRSANHDETHGIVIGPEVSRIFAEMIFQAIDLRTQTRLREDKLRFSVDYAIRRYVDDVYIFANEESTAQKVYETYADNLVDFNLHANASKRTQIERPFMTKKSRLIADASEAANEFFASFLTEAEKINALRPTPIRNKWNFARNFIQKVKSICSGNQVPYDDLASFLISIITERIKRLVDVDQPISPDLRSNYRDAVLVLLEVLFFLYAVAPSVGASYRFATSLIVIIRFFSERLSIFERTIKQRIYDLTETLLSSPKFTSGSPIGGFVSLEAVNVVLASRELGSDYLLPSEMVQNLFLGGTRLSYFGIISCLFYIRDEKEYRVVSRVFRTFVES